MKIIICGAGQVGYGIAERLSAEKNDVSVIDIVPQLIHNLCDVLDVKGFVGHGSHPDVLEEAGAAEADVIIAATLYDEVNIVACEVARALFDIPMKIARIRSQAYLKAHYVTRDQVSIDAIISPEAEVGEMLLQRIAFPGAHDVVRLIDDKIIMLAVKCAQDCPAAHTPLFHLSTLFPDLSSTIVGLQRNSKLLIAQSKDILLPGDIAYVITPKDQVRRTLSLLGYEEPESERIVIAGGGNIGFYVAQALENKNKHTRVKIIENNIERTRIISGRLHNSIVLHGSALDQKLLSEAEVQDADLIISLTNNDQVNILSGVMAKQMGVRRNLSLINQVSYLDLAESIGIDTYINPGNVTISCVLPHVRRGRIRGVYSVDKGRAELIQAEALETSPLVEAPLSNLNISSGIRIGGVYRDGEFIKPSGSLHIKPKDQVIIFALSSAIKNVEQLFRINLDFF